MFDIGFWELMLIGVVGLVVIGPDRLPGVARKLGYWVGRARRFVNSVRQDIDREIRQDELRQALERDASLDEIKTIINDSRFTIEDETEHAKPEHVVKAHADEAKIETTDSQQDLLKEQEDEFVDEDYGLTDHTDYGAEEIEQQINNEITSKSEETVSKKEHGEAKTKSS
jgi:sec-independent protein translocase protein TatB